MSGALPNRTEITPELSEAGIFLENVHQIVGRPFTFRCYRTLQGLSADERNFLWGTILGAQLRSRGPSQQIHLFLQISFSAIDLQEVAFTEPGDRDLVLRTRKVKGLSIWIDPEAKGRSWSLVLHPMPAPKGKQLWQFNEVLSISGILFIGHCYFGGIEFFERTP